MKMPWILLCVVLLSPSAFARSEDGGDHTNNGGGLAEQNFIYAHQTLVSWIDPCRDLKNPCQLTKKELRTLDRILYELERSKTKSELIFKSGRLNPGLFETDEHGKVRVAVTGLEPGTPIYINLDLIYADSNGSQSIVDLYGAISILVHEYGHHTGETDHLFLDQLGNKVRVRREQFVEEINLSRFLHPELRVLAHNFERDVDEYFPIPGKPLSSIVIENGHSLVDLTEQFYGKITCPVDVPLEAAHFANLTWHRVENYDAAKGRQPFTLSLDLDYICRIPMGDRYENSIRLEWKGWFKVMYLGPTGELMETEYGSDWKIRDGMRFQLEESAVELK